MVSEQTVFLMYHELELPGRKLCQAEPGYVRYVLPIETFREQMSWLKKAGWRGLNVSEALHSPAKPAVCITFDDGCETDLLGAAPVLSEHRFNATFYLTAGFLGKPGYLSEDQVRGLDAQGFQIGCHSMTHPYLSDLSESELKHEIVDAKLKIETIVGHPIEHFSCPGGRYNEQALKVARQAGFTTVANSEYHANSSRTNPFELGRVAIQRNLTLQTFQSTCAGQGLWKKRLQNGARRGAQRVLGNRGYDRLRASLLGEHQE